MKILVPIAVSIALSVAATLIAVVASRLITRGAFRSEPDEVAVAEPAAAI
jgi:hypothetical protein